MALAEALAGKTPDFARVPNFVFRDGKNRVSRSAATAVEQLDRLPAPDFDGLPLASYFSPTLVLPYDPTRGCYWGRCAFCHYGLAEEGTSAYRERPIDQMVEHLGALEERYQTRLFYFSEDTIAPKTLHRLAQALKSASLDIRWASDIRPEKDLTEERARVLREGGALALSLGIESASARVLSLIEKGIDPQTMREVVGNLARAEIAVEAMCFSDFPTETAREARETLRFIEEMEGEIALFILGEFYLTHGARMAREPERFGIDKPWVLAGDQFEFGLLYDEKDPSKSAGERARLDRELAAIARRFRLSHYPWAGALSTAHTLLHYDKLGPRAFHGAAPQEPATPQIGKGKSRRFSARQLALAEERERAIWQHLVTQRREVSRAIYDELADEQPHVRPVTKR